VLTTLQLREQDQKVIGDRDVKLSSMEMSDPEGEFRKKKKKRKTHLSTICICIYPQLNFFYSSSSAAVLVSHESETDRKYQTEALQASLASLNLPVPEMMMRANLRADGLSTPGPLWADSR
jgi:hypothetical protein